MAKFGEFFRGIGLSENEKTKFHTMVNVDVHSSQGKVKCSKELVNIDSGGLIDDLGTCSLVTSVGDAFYGCGDKVFRVSSGTVVLVHTSTLGDVIGLGEHDGILYYATATHLGKITVALASSESPWTSQASSFGLFDNDATHKPIVWVNQILCIGDGNYVAIVDEYGDFYPNALDILERDVITALHNMNDYLAIGTFVDSAIHQASFYNWDTYSPTWTEDYKLKERGVNVFFDIDGYTYALAGSIGNIYQWTGERAVLFLPLKDADENIVTTVNSYGSTNLNGLTLLTTNRGVFSLGKTASTMPLAIVIEYMPNLGNGTTLGAIEAIGSDIQLCYEKDGSFGIDHIGTNYATGHIITPEVDGKMNKLMIDYTDMPTGCSITSSVKIDNGSFASLTLVQDDANLRQYYSQNHVNNKSTVQAKIILNPSTTTTPIIKQIEL